MINSYPSLYNVGHRAVEDLFTKPVLIEEKVDGSQFSFKLTETGELEFRSKGKQIDINAPEKMFNNGINAISEIKSRLTPGFTYRGEYLSKPKHNTLAYDRAPNHHVIIFDICWGEECYLSREQKEAECARIGLECVPVLFMGLIGEIGSPSSLLDRVSCLGGPKIEGVVVKPLEYNVFGVDKKLLIAKLVSEEFKEVHGKEWKKANPQSADIIQALGASLKTEARWAKAVQHLNEAGQLQNGPQDIGLLLKEVPQDIEKECKDEIMQALYNWAWPQLRRVTTHGLPEWYKGKINS